MRKKNSIPKYHACSLIQMLRNIQDHQKIFYMDLTILNYINLQIK